MNKLHITKKLRTGCMSRVPGRIFVSALLVFLMLPLGCGEDDKPTEPQNVLPYPRYEGHVTINMRQGFDPYFPIERIDSITLSVTGDAYALTFQTENSRICSSIGRLSYNKEVRYLTLDLGQPTDTQCDSVRIPHGSFAVTFNGKVLEFDGDYIITIPNTTRDDTIRCSFELRAP